MINVLKILTLSRTNPAFKLSSVSMLTGVLVIIGWQFDIGILKSIIKGYIEMNPLTAVNFILLSLVTAFKTLDNTSKSQKFFVSSLLAIESAILFFLLSDLLFHSAFKVDRILFHDILGANKMAPATIINFCLIVLALLMTGKRKKWLHYVSQAVILFCLYASLIYLCGYIFNVSALTTSSRFTPMALHTSFCFIMLSFSILFLNPADGFIKYINSAALGGKLARKMLPLMFVTPFAVGYFRLMGQHYDFYNTEFGTAIMTVTIAILSAIHLGYHAKLLNRLDRERQVIDEELVKQSEALKRSQYLLNNTSKMARIGGWELDLITKKGVWTDEIFRIHELDSANNPSLEDGLKYYSKDKRHLIENALQQCMDNGIPYELELPFITAKGNKLWISTSGHPIYENGKIVRLSGVFQDITERKRIEQLAKKASADSQKILDTSIDVICAFNSSGKFIQVSKACTDVWGYTAEELLHTKLLKNIASQDVKLTLKAAKKIVAGTRVTNFENHFIRKDGTLVPVVWSAYWSNEEQTMFCVARDATQRKSLEKAIDQERKRFEDMFHQAPSCLAILQGPEHVFTMANPLYLQLTGKKDIIGRPVREILPEVEEQGFIGLLNDVYETGKTYAAKEMLARIDTDGSGQLKDLYLDFVYQPYRNDAGEIDGIFFFANDVTEQVTAREKVEKNEERYRHLINELPGAIYTCDMEGRILLYNKAAAELWGREPEIGKELWCGSYKQFSPEGVPIPLERCPMALTIKAKAAVKGQEILVEQPNGMKRNILPHPIPVYDAHGNMEGAINMLIDITEHKNAEKALTKQQIALTMANSKLKEKNITIEQARQELTLRAKELQESNIYKSQFLANMSHELRTPLNSILILASLLIENVTDNLTEKQIGYANIISKSGTDLLNLINDILDLSKIESGKMELVYSNELVQCMTLGFEELFRVVSKEKDIDFEIIVTDAVPEYLYTDRQRLEQIVKNLLSNAFKFTREQGEITLTLDISKPGNELIIAVKDTGIGVEEEKQKIIFEAFKQANGTTTRQFGGTGLGLSICKQLTWMLGGEIKLESKFGEGSTFKVYLPLRSKPEESSPAEASHILPEEQQEPNYIASSFAGKRILIADDDMRNIFALKSLLEEHGFEVLTAFNGRDAVNQLHEYPGLDLILMDMMMPEMDGYQAMKHIRDLGNYGHLPIIALTAKAMPADLEKCIEAGASAYISKPFKNKMLLEKMHSLIN